MCQFQSTFELFEPAVKATRLNLNKYEGWIHLPDDLKVAGLYVRFFTEIKKAWEKSKRPYIEDELAVSTLIQYLMKNVDLIKWQRKRYCEAYMYSVAFNALFPLTRVQGPHDWYYGVMSTPFYELDEDVFNAAHNGDIDSDNCAYIESWSVEREPSEFADELLDKQLAEFWTWIRETYTDSFTIRAIEKVIKGSDRPMTGKQKISFDKAAAEILKYIMENCPDLLNCQSAETVNITKQEARDMIVRTTQLLSKVYRVANPLPIHDEAALNEHLDRELEFINQELEKLIPEKIRKLAV